jgi:DNA-binding response OmpR family regulator
VNAIRQNEQTRPGDLRIALGPLRVLVADDEHDTADGLMRILHHQGFDVRVAYDGAEALREAWRFFPDVVILDIGMPQLSGYDVARALRARISGVVLIAITAYKESTDKILAQMAGFDHHFGKPCDPGAIVELLGTLKPRQ